jgi:hypothetical protein
MKYPVQTISILVGVKLAALVHTWLSATPTNDQGRQPFTIGTDSVHPAVLRALVGAQKLPRSI